MAPSKISVVIPTKNAGPAFQRVLDALNAQAYDSELELIVIDSGSTDDTVAMALRSGALATSIPPAEFNHGLTRNRAIESASGDIVVMLSQDAVPANQHLIRSFVKAFEDPQVAGAYARQVPQPDADSLSQRNAAATLAGRTTGEIHWIKDWTAYRNLSPLERYQFCNFDDVCSGLRKGVWRTIPFRANEFGEDIDWGQRALEAGWKIAYVPEAVVIHSHPPSFTYLYQRHRLTLKKLYEQFGVSTVPSRRALVLGTLSSTLRDWYYVLRHERHIPALIMAFVKIPFYSFAGLYGQYRGAKDARQRPN